MSKTCEHESALTGPCTAPAITFRKAWRWGVEAKGEPPIVHLRVKLCAECALRWDDNAAEGAAEAAGS